MFEIQSAFAFAVGSGSDSLSERGAADLFGTGVVVLAFFHATFAFLGKVMCKVFLRTSWKRQLAIQIKQIHVHQRFVRGNCGKTSVVSCCCC